MLYKISYLKSQEKLKQEKKNNFFPVKQNCAENRSDSVLKKYYAHLVFNLSDDFPTGKKKIVKQFG